MKFIVLLKKYFISLLLILLFVKEIINAKLNNKKGNIKQNRTKATMILNKVQNENDQMLKNIELITLPNKKKFSISTKDLKVIL